MDNFSAKITTFLKKVGRDDKSYWAPVPRSVSCGKVGDFLIFKYLLPGQKAEDKDVEQRLVMIVKPVVKSPKTGNILLSAKKVDMGSINSSDELENLYNRRASSYILSVLGMMQGMKQKKETDYRTYRMNRIEGQLYGLRRKL